jgi:hypothetical protein
MPPQDRLDDISKGVLHVEADRMSRTRIDRFTAMVGQYAALCIASGVRCVVVVGGRRGV